MTSKQKRILKGFFTNPKNLVVFVFTRFFTHFIKDDRRYLKLLFRLEMGKKLDLENPRTFNEKLQWLKLNNRKPEYSQLVDKYEVKRHVSSVIGEEYIIPTISVYDSFDEIDFTAFPSQFVLKCTHDSGRVVVCKDKASFDFKAAQKRINKALHTNFYLREREWPYKDVKPRIIAEKYMQDGNTEELEDYKFYCFDGKVGCVLVCKGRSMGVKYYYFDNQWNFLRWDKETSKEPDGFSLPKPKHLDQMIAISEKLSKGIPHVRVDLYDINDCIYFGELTFFTDGGLDTDITNECDWILGEKLVLPQIP